MELLLIRHALPDRVELEVGAADPELSEQGRAQAGHLAGYLAIEHRDALYSSPLRRAWQTAEAVSPGRGVDIVASRGVAEWDMNSSEYVPLEELKAADDPRWHALLNGEWVSDESEEEFRTRAVGAIEQHIAEHRGQRIAIVCHGGVINAYLATLLSLRGGFERGFFYPNYTSIHRVAAASTGQREIVTVNETSHLRGTGLPMGLFQRS
jgi:probable phosphoglycerate mutase